MDKSQTSNVSFNPLGMDGIIEARPFKPISLKALLNPESGEESAAISMVSSLSKTLEPQQVPGKSLPSIIDPIHGRTARFRNLMSAMHGLPLSGSQMVGPNVPAFGDNYGAYFVYARQNYPIQRKRSNISCLLPPTTTTTRSPLLLPMSGSTPTTTMSSRTMPDSGANLNSNYLRNFSPSQYDEDDTSINSKPYARSPRLKHTHKLAERKRRSELRSMFEQLEALLPNRERPLSKSEIVQSAIETIDRLADQKTSLLSEREILRAELRGATDETEQVKA